jgi:hypothetical protein
VHSCGAAGFLVVTAVAVPLFLLASAWAWRLPALLVFVFFFPVAVAVPLFLLASAWAWMLLVLFRFVFFFPLVVVNDAVVPAAGAGAVAVAVAGIVDVAAAETRLLLVP